jgi:hypothetical protein
MSNEVQGRKSHHHHGQEVSRIKTNKKRVKERGSRDTHCTLFDPKRDTKGNVREGVVHKEERQV